MIDDFLARVRKGALVMVLGSTTHAAVVARSGRRALCVTDLQSPEFLGMGPDVEVIDARIGPDACMVKMIDGYWLRPITLPEIINQLPGPYDAVISNLDGRDRMVAQSDTLKAMYPQALAYPDDGNNEGVITLYKRRGYESQVVDGWLILWRTA